MNVDTTWEWDTVIVVCQKMVYVPNVGMMQRRTAMSKCLCDYHDDWYEMKSCPFHEPHKDANNGRRCEFWNMETGECYSDDKFDIMDWEPSDEST